LARKETHDVGGLPTVNIPTAPTQHNTANYKNLEYEKMESNWRLMNHCYVGTPAIVEENSLEYLPMYPDEGHTSYLQRKKCASYYNVVKRTESTLVGIAFRKPMILGDDVNEKLRDLCEDIDLKGNSLNIFAQEVAGASIRYGHTFIMVEAPKAPEGLTVKEAKEMNIRPYWVHITPDRILNWRHTTVGGVPILTQVSISEAVTKPSGRFGQVVKQYVRVYFYDEDTRAFQWELQNERGEVEDSGVLLTDYIPLLAVYSNKLGQFQSIPLLLDLAHMNIRHFQMMTDLHYHLHLCAIPMLMLKNRASSGSKFIIAPSMTIDVSSDGDARWVELEGEALQYQMDEISKLEQRMYAMGISTFMRKAVERRTATENVIDFATAYSDVQKLLLNMKDVFEQALIYTAYYMNLDEGGSINISTDYNLMGADPQEMRVMLEYYTANILPELEMRKYLDRNGLVSDEFDTVTPKAQKSVEMLNVNAQESVVT
jgi:hypothetical protein